MLLRSMQNTRRSSYTQAENDALRDAAAAGQRLLYQSSLSVSVKPPPPPAWIMQPPPDWHTAERDYFTLRERLITMQKQLEGTQKYINYYVYRVAHIDGNLCNYCIIHTALPAEYKCLK